MAERRYVTPVRGVGKIFAAFAVGLVLTFSTAFLLPQTPVSFMIGFLTAVFVAGGVFVIDERRWLGFAALVTSALGTLGTAALPANLALAESGQRVEATVVDDVVTNPWVSGMRTTSHKYVLRRPDGRPLGQDLVAASDSGHELDVGDAVTVLVDPDGKVPVMLADKVDPGAFLTAAVTGVVATSLILVMVARRSRRGRPL